MAVLLDEKFGIFRRIWLKVRYGAVIQECLERIGKLGLKLELYYLLVENGSSRESSLLSNPPMMTEGFETGFFEPDEIMAVSRLPGSGVTEQQALEWFGKGRRCFGAKQGGKILSYVWCSFRECHFLNLRIPLKENEVYLFNTQTLRGHRGKNLAGFVRYRLYGELAGQGLVHFYSIVSVFNRPSLNVKKKLGARKVKLYFYLGLTKKWNRNFCLKEFDPAG